MLNLKKLLTKLCERVATQKTTITAQYRTGVIYLRKSGDIVTCWSTGDFQNLPAASTTIATIPEGYRPAASVGTKTLDRVKDVIITIGVTGNMNAYNYGAAMTSLENGGFSITWTTV